MKKLNPLTANRFKPAVYDKKNLIDFSRPLRWMNGVERYKFAISSDKLFYSFCAVVAAYFIFRFLFR